MTHRKTKANIQRNKHFGKIYFNNTVQQTKSQNWRRKEYEMRERMKKNKITVGKRGRKCHAPAQCANIIGMVVNIVSSVVCWNAQCLCWKWIKEMKKKKKKKKSKYDKKYEYTELTKWVHNVLADDFFFLSVFNLFWNICRNKFYEVPSHPFTITFINWINVDVAKLFVCWYFIVLSRAIIHVHKQNQDVSTNSKCNITTSFALFSFHFFSFLFFSLIRFSPVRFIFIS